jgi:hypothetical protein
MQRPAFLRTNITQNYFFPLKMQSLDELKDEIQTDIKTHSNQVNHFKKTNKIWRVVIVLMTLSNGVLSHFADMFTVMPLIITYKLWNLLLPSIVAINYIFDSKIEIEENQRLLNEKRNLLVQIKAELMRSEQDRQSPELFYEQTAEALEIINRGARN